MLRIDGACAGDLISVARAMRERDVMEFLATSHAKDRAELAQALWDRYRSSDELIGAYLDDEPVAIGGLLQHRPRVCTLLFFATDRFPRAALGLTRFVRQRLFPAVIAGGCHRIECVSHEDHHDAHRWIRILGLRQEAVLRGFGRNGETFLQFAWVKDACATSH